MLPQHEKIIDLRQKNPKMTLADIGRIVGLSRERVRQILVRHGLSTKAFRPKPFCPLCGKPSLRALKTSCLECKAKRKWVYLPCDHCGRAVKKSRLLRERQMKDPRYTNKRTFCNKACMGQWLGANYGRLSISRLSPLLPNQNVIFRIERKAYANHSGHSGTVIQRYCYRNSKKGYNVHCKDCDTNLYNVAHKSLEAV